MQCQGAQSLLQAKQRAEVGDRRVGKIEALQPRQGAHVHKARVVEVNVTQGEGAKAPQAAEAKANRLLQGRHGESCEDKSLEGFLQDGHNDQVLLSEKTTTTWHFFNLLLQTLPDNICLLPDPAEYPEW